MILTSTKYHGNLLKDSSWSLLSLVIFFTALETKKVLKIQNRTFLKITRYFLESMAKTPVAERRAIAKNGICDGVELELESNQS